MNAATAARKTPPAGHRKIAPITPADADLSPIPNMLVVTAVGGGTTLNIRNIDGTDVALTVAAGVRIECPVLRVRAGTTATVAGYY